MSAPVATSAMPARALPCDTWHLWMLLNSLCQVLDGKRESSLAHGPGTGHGATGLIARRFRLPNHKDVLQEEGKKHRNPLLGEGAKPSAVGSSSRLKILHQQQGTDITLPRDPAFPGPCSGCAAVLHPGPSLHPCPAALHTEPSSALGQDQQFIPFLCITQRYGS